MIVRRGRPLSHLPTFPVPSRSHPRGILWGFTHFGKLNCIDWIRRVAASTPKLNHYVINRNKGSQRRRIPNPIPSSARFSHRERMTVHEASGLKLHARAHETQNTVCHKKKHLWQLSWRWGGWIFSGFSPTSATNLWCRWNTFCLVFPALRTTGYVRFWQHFPSTAVLISWQCCCQIPLL